MKNYLKICFFLIVAILTLKNCEKNDEILIEEKLNLNQENLKTVSFSDAKDYFNKQNILLAKSESSLELNPIWKTLKHEDLFLINGAKLTTSNVLINKEGNYESELFFINVNEKIHQAIYTIYKEKVNENGVVTDGLVFLNELDGTFIDGYRIKEGLFTEKFVIKENKEVQKAGFLLMLFQSGLF